MSLSLSKVALNGVILYVPNILVRFTPVFLTCLAIAFLVTCGKDSSTQPTPSEPQSPPPFQPVASRIEITPSSVSLNAIGRTVRLAAKVFDQNNTPMAIAVVSWTSNNQAVATVNAQGLVTALSNGNATITARSGNASAWIEVKVMQEAGKIVIEPAAAALTALGETVQLNATVLDQNGQPVASAVVTWTSKDESIASVSVQGLVTALSNGHTVVTARSGDTSANTTVTVSVPTIALLTPSKSAYGPQEAGKPAHEKIVVLVSDESGEMIANASWNWVTDEQSGWVYPSKGVTASDGRIAVTWVAGSSGSGILSLSADNIVSSKTLEIETESVDDVNPPGSDLYLNIPDSRRATGFSIDITPLTEPEFTFYCAVQWDGGYTGLQRRGSRYDYQLQFSIWDAQGIDAQLIARGNDVVCSPFGGEGTGQKCELNYPWFIGDTYRFEVTEEVVNGRSEITLHVTDLSTDTRKFVGTIRYGLRANLFGFSMFVENFIRRAPNCIAREVRSFAVRRAMALVDGSWVRIDNGYMGRQSIDPGNPGNVACANVAIRPHPSGLEVVTGGRTASDPKGPTGPFMIP